MPPRSPTPISGELQGPDRLISGGIHSTDSPCGETSSGQHSEYLPTSRATGSVPAAPRPQARKRGKPKKSIAQEAAQEKDTRKLQSPKKPQARTARTFSLPSSPSAPKMAPQKAGPKAPVLEVPQKGVPRSPALAEPRGRKRGANSDLAATLFKRVVALRPQEPLSASDQASSPPDPAPRARVVRDVLNVFQSDPISPSLSDSGSLPDLGLAGNSQDIFEIVQFSGRPDDTSDTAPTSPVGHHPKTDTSAADKTGNNPEPPKHIRLPSTTAMSHGDDSIAASCAPASNSNGCSPVPRIVPATASDRSPPQQQPSPIRPRVVLAVTSPLDALRKHTHVPPNIPPAGGLRVEPVAQRSPASAQAPRPCIVVSSSSPSSPDPSPHKVRARPSKKLTLRLGEGKKNPASPRLLALNPPRQTEDSRRPSRHDLYSTSSRGQPGASPVLQNSLSGGSPVASGSDGTDGPSQYRREVLQAISRIIDSNVDELNRKEASLDMVTSDFLRLAQTVDKLCRVHQQEQADLILRYRQRCDHVVQNLGSAHEAIEESLPGPDLFDFRSIVADARSRSTEAKRALTKLDYGN